VATGPYTHDAAEARRELTAAGPADRRVAGASPPVPLRRPAELARPEPATTGPRTNADLAEAEASLRRDAANRPSIESAGRRMAELGKGVQIGKLPKHPPRALRQNPELVGCLVSAARIYGLPVAALWAIMETEGGTIGTASRNQNGTFDYGPMQINTIWEKPLASIYGVPREVVRQKLRYDGCFNIGISAWILKTEINGAGGDLWRGVGHYHSKTARFRDRYLGKIRDSIVRWYGPVAMASAR
jgi:hypothetical protein